MKATETGTERRCHWPGCPHGPDCVHARDVVPAEAAHRISEVNDRAKEARSALIRIAAGLARGTYMPGIDTDHWYVSTPVAERSRIVKALDETTETHIELASQLKRIADSLTAAAPPPPAPAAEPVSPWQPIATAPKDRLIDVWVRERDGRGYRLASAYHDAYCEEWRTSRPDSRLVAVKAWHCTHWMPIPCAPDQP